MADIIIPPEALEAGLQAIAAHNENLSVAALCACFNAMVKAWPGMSLHQQDINAQYSYFVLPLPQENPNG